MQLKHRLKQFTAVALSCLSVISTPLTAYAVGGNTGSGDNEGIHGGCGPTWVQTVLTPVQNFKSILTLPFQTAIRDIW